MYSPCIFTLWDKIHHGGNTCKRAGMKTKSCEVDSLFGWRRPCCANETNIWQGCRHRISLYLLTFFPRPLCHSFRNLKSVKLISVLRTKIYALPIINCILSIESSWLCFTCISWNPQKSLSWDTVKARTSSIASNIGSFRSFGQRFLHMKATEQDNGAFSVILSAAISGNNDALVQLILMYRPLIDGLSVTDGGINEDLRQELLIHLIKKIRYFSI